MMKAGQTAIYKQGDPRHQAKCVITAIHDKDRRAHIKLYRDISTRGFTQATESLCWIDDLTKETKP